MIDDHIALLPQDLAKQVAACRSVQSSLRTYQRELASLWVQGRELERDASDKERTETLARLEELQSVFENALQRTTQRLADLERALTSRTYFQVDLNKTCQWLRQADSVTFPEVDLSKIDESSELQTQLSNFQKVLEEASEYENLLLIVQRIGQEILRTLNEIDHCYLDERLNALPQQYNAILALAKEKKDRVQHIILERKEFSTFLDVTRNALEELQGQLDNLEKQTIISMRGEDVVCLMNEYRNVDKSLLHINAAVREIHSKNEGFLCRGQQYRVEEMQQLILLCNSIKKRADHKITHLNNCLTVIGNNHRALTSLDSELMSVREEVVKLKSDKVTKHLEKITYLYLLLERLDRMISETEECNSQTQGLGLKFENTAFTEAAQLLESLISLRGEIKRMLDASEVQVTENEDFTRDTDQLLQRLRTIKDTVEEPLILSEVSTEQVQKESREVRIIEEEVGSCLRRADASGAREKQSCRGRKETAHVEEKLQEVRKLAAEVQQRVCVKKVNVIWLSILLLIPQLFLLCFSH